MNSTRTSPPRPIRARAPVDSAERTELPAIDGGFDVSANDSGEIRLDDPADPDGEAAAQPPAEGEPVEGDPAALRLESIIESLVFASDKPLALKQLGDLMGESDLIKIREHVTAIQNRYPSTRGIQLHGVAGGFQFRTSPENATYVQKLLAQKPVRLSRAQLETLAIVSYRQPITRPEIDEIRGVDSGGALKTLLDRSLIRILGKREEPGRPMLYGTTKDFLEFFNLSDLKDLPTLREFHELSEEHQAQVAALESAAPEGSIESVEEAKLAEAARRPLERVTLSADTEDTKELEEIDRLIEGAGQVGGGRSPAQPELDLSEPPASESEPTESEEG